MRLNPVIKTQAHIFINWCLKYYGTGKSICGNDRKKLARDLRLSNMMNNLSPSDNSIYLFIFKFMKAWKIKPLNYFPLLRERKHPKPLISHHFKRIGPQLEVLEFCKPKPGIIQGWWWLSGWEVGYRPVLYKSYINWKARDNKTRKNKSYISQKCIL